VGEARIQVVSRDDGQRHRLERLLAERAPWAVCAPGETDVPAAVVLACAAEDAAAEIEALQAGNAPIVVVLPSARPVDLRAAVVAGAAGVVEERSAEVALVATLGAALAGQLVLPSTARTAVAPPPLSRREKQVLGLVVLGLSNADIASRLHVTEATVKSHLTAGFRKLGVRTRSAAAARILDPREGLGIGILSLTEPDATLNVLTEA
jgi:DNA-binding NarL/FixJ family response regulator